MTSEYRYRVDGYEDIDHVDRGSLTSRGSDTLREARIYAKQYLREPEFACLIGYVQITRLSDLDIVVEDLFA